MFVLLITISRGKVQSVPSFNQENKEIRKIVWTYFFLILTFNL